MKRIIEGKLYNTDTATLVYRQERRGCLCAVSLWETNNGGWFYIYERSSGWDMHSFEDPIDLYASWARDRGFDDYETDGAAQVWLERHGAVDEVLERWPHRMEAG